jgi:hypothetical protein
VAVSNVSFYLAVTVPLAGILINAALILVVNRRLSRLDRCLRAGFDLALARLNSADARLARILAMEGGL